MSEIQILLRRKNFKYNAPLYNPNKHNFTVSINTLSLILRLYGRINNDFTSPKKSMS